MGFPKQIKKDLQIVPQKTLFARRQQLLEYINKDGTYLPKSVLHADLDRGMLDFVKDELKTVVSGKIIPFIDVIITNQNWTQFAETWSFVDKDLNVQPPFITVVRQPEVKYGTNPSLTYTIPVRKQFYYASVPTWNGNQQGMDFYTIPQPIPVDITYQIKIICNRMRELNQFNKNVLRKFSSRQSYTFIKGQYVPIVMTNLLDESVQDLDKRKYYVQSYEFLLQGYLIDEEEFQVKPAIQRVATLIEVEESLKKKPKKEPKNIRTFDFNFLFVVGNTTLTDVVDYAVNMDVESTENISSYDVFVNGDFYGTDVSKIMMNTNDTITINVIKNDIDKESYIKFINKLV